MQLIRFQISPQTSFTTEIKGDSLFGHLCWAYRENYGNDKLDQLLAKYNDSPFIVCSDAFPTGYLPRPILPNSIFLENLNSKDQDKFINKRKEIKASKWIKSSFLLEGKQSLKNEMHKLIRDKSEQIVKDPIISTIDFQTHCAINRQSSSTGDDEFAPRTKSRIFYDSKSLFDIYVLFDDKQITQKELNELLYYVGMCGYGAEASRGFGKFTVQNPQLHKKIDFTKCEYVMTLSPFCPSDTDKSTINKENSYYNVFTRFGRLGNINSQTKNPFKYPVLMIDTGSVLCYTQNAQEKCGMGVNKIVNGNDKIVHQGYSINIPIKL